MSLGATRNTILTMVLKQACRLTAVGLVIGLVLATALSAGMSRVLFGVVTVRATTFANFIAVLGGAAVVAGYIPAYRAAKVDPVIALRHE